MHVRAECCNFAVEKMYRLRLTLILLASFFALTLPAQKKNVDAAWRLVGKTESVDEARKLLKEAMEDEKTGSQARTYYVAAMVEWRSFEADQRKREINPKDASVTDDAMTSKLLQGYRYMLKALPLDSMPDKKGRIKPRYSNDILSQLDAKAYDLYRAGAISYAAKKYYPQAYDGFVAAAALASNPAMIRSRKLLPDTLLPNLYYYAGLSAYGGKESRRALRAFGKAEALGKHSENLYLYSMAIWEQMARDSVNMQQEAQDSLLRIATRAYKHHGTTQPDFLSRLTQIYIATGQTDSIMSILNRQIALTPDEWLPRALRGWVNESIGRTDAAAIDYKLAAENPDISSKMLMRGAHMLYRTAHARKDKITGNVRQRRKAGQDLIDIYLIPAANMAKRAQEKTTDPKDLQLIRNILDAVDYDTSLLK